MGAVSPAKHLQLNDGHVYEVNDICKANLLV